MPDTPSLRTRPNVLKLGDWDPPILWYARAVSAMKARPITEPTSWRYQAAIHDYIEGDDPFGSPPQLPSDRDEFWAKCQHSSWFFLPWHRSYLFVFEQIVAATIVDLGGPPDWSLPFWDYSDTQNANARILPPAFRAKKTPDGNNNPLFVTQRFPAINTGHPLPRSAVSLNSLNNSEFAGRAQGGHPGFGGIDESGDHPSGTPGDLETTPHGDVHDSVGGDGGFMSAFHTAALDPIFWLHHANIDRLWEVWRNKAAHGHGFVNPTKPSWLNGQGVSFSFHDATGAVVTLLPSQVTDTSAAPLSYQYEGVAVPAQSSAVVAAAENREPMMASVSAPPEMVAASAKSTPLSSEPTDVSLTLEAPRGAAAGMRVGTPSSKRIFVNFENVTGSGPIPGFEVFIGEGTESILAGSLPMFGVAEASKATRQHPGSGITYVVEITDAVAELKRKNIWDPTKLKVSIKPRRALAGKVEVGRISIYEQ